MKWVTHILWAALPYRLVAPTDVALAMAAVATVLTDAAGHTGLRRNKYHDLLAAASHVLTALLYSPTPNSLLAGAVAGLTHVALDYASPGRLAVSWPYNAAWIIPAVWLWTHFF